jgi:hypothetical protein
MELRKKPITVQKLVKLFYQEKKQTKKINHFLKNEWCVCVHTKNVLQKLFCFDIGYTVL